MVQQISKLERFCDENGDSIYNDCEDASNNLTDNYFYIFDVEKITFTLPISVGITRTNDDGDDIVIGSNVITSFDANERFDFETKFCL